MPSRADSDGFFCTPRGYLAYELRNGITPRVVGHVLRVVRFEPNLGIYVAGQVILQDFQVHHMIRSTDRVEISGWEQMFKKYVIEIPGPEKVHVGAYIEDPTQRFDTSGQGPEPPQLGIGGPGAIALESLDPDHKCQRLLSRSGKAVQGGVEIYRKAELIQVDLQGDISQRLVLHEDRFVEVGD